jgi:hypothetical protein
MKTKREMQNMICKSLGSHLDPVFKQLGFTREMNSVEYIRKLVDGEQRVCIFSEHKPNYEPLAWARLYPQIRLSFPAVNRIASDLVGGQTALIGGGDWTFSQPIDLVIPKQHHKCWFIYDEHSVESCMQSLLQSLQTWILSFLNEYTSIESLTIAYANKDPRFVWSRALCVFVTAALIHGGQLKKAAEVLETKFGRPGVRLQYGMAFDYVTNLEASGK